MTVAAINPVLQFVETAGLLIPVGIGIELGGRMIGPDRNLLELIGRVYQVVTSYSMVHWMLDFPDEFGPGRLWVDLIQSRVSGGASFKSPGSPLILAACVMSQLLPEAFKRTLGEHHIVTRFSVKLSDLIDKVSKAINISVMYMLVIPYAPLLFGLGGLAVVVYCFRSADPRIRSMIPF